MTDSSRHEPENGDRREDEDRGTYPPDPEQPRRPEQPGQDRPDAYGEPETQPYGQQHGHDPYGQGPPPGGQPYDQGAYGQQYGQGYQGQQYGQPQYGQGYQGQQYGQQQYGQGYQQDPYGQQPHQPPYAQPGYGYQQGGYYGGYPPQQDHPQSTMALVLGLIGLIGTLFCLAPALVGPFAWYVGGKAKKEIDASGGQLGGRGQALTGYVLGIITTALLVLLILGFGLLIAVAMAGGFDDTGSVTAAL